MNKYRLLPASALVAVFAVSAAFAQRPAPSPQRPVVSPTQPAPTAQANVVVPTSKLAVIYSDAFLDPKTGIAKFNVLQATLNREFQKQKDDLTQMQQRMTQLQDEIGKALEVFAKARSITLIIDGTQVPMVYAADSIDITRAFIIEFNSKNPATASATPPE